MALFQLLYMSSLVADDAQSMSDIVDVADRNNKQRNITGMMLYADGNILQVLEGEEEVVQATFLTIQLDRRHRGIFVILEKNIETRQFASWTMGFRQLTKADLEQFPIDAQVFNASDAEIAVRGLPSDALTVLKSFADGSMTIV